MVENKTIGKGDKIVLITGVLFAIVAVCYSFVFLFYTKGLSEMVYKSVSKADIPFFMNMVAGIKIVAFGQCGSVLLSAFCLGWAISKITAYRKTKINDKSLN